MPNLQTTPQDRVATLPASAPPPQMMLIFTLSGEKFALSVDWVHEILDPIARTNVPFATPFAPALINVRGNVAPLIDIRQRLQMKPADNTAEARVIVLEIPVDNQPVKLALLADSVDEVFETDGTPPEPVPELGARWPQRFIKGVARHNGELVILLNTETLFMPDVDRPALS
jgi:purine-binding chemotaxis protein CheW